MASGTTGWQHVNTPRHNMIFSNTTERLTWLLLIMTDHTNITASTSTLIEQSTAHSKPWKPLLSLHENYPDRFGSESIHRREVN